MSILRFMSIYIGFNRLSAIIHITP